MLENIIKKGSRLIMSAATALAGYACNAMPTYDMQAVEKNVTCEMAEPGDSEFLHEGNVDDAVTDETGRLYIAGHTAPLPGRGIDWQISVEHMLAGGASNWEHTFGGSRNDTPSRIIYDNEATITVGHGVDLVDSNSEKDWKVQAIDRSGNIVPGLSIDINEGTQAGASDIVALGNDRYAVVGSSNKQGSFEPVRDGIVYIISKGTDQANIVSRNTFDSGNTDYYTAVGKNSNGNILVAGNSDGKRILHVYSPNLDLVQDWSSNTLDGKLEVVKHIEVDQDDNIYLVGFAENRDREKNLSVTSYDKFGNLRWQNVLEDYDPNRATIGLRAAIDNGILGVVGYEEVVAEQSGRNTDWYVGKMDTETGELLCSTTYDGGKDGSATAIFLFKQIPGYSEQEQGGTPFIVVGNKTLDNDSTPYRLMKKF